MRDAVAPGTRRGRAKFFAMSTGDRKSRGEKLAASPRSQAGDSVRVATSRRRGHPRRTQVFAGRVLKRQGHGAREEPPRSAQQSFGVGVERKFSACTRPRSRGSRWPRARPSPGHSSTTAPGRVGKRARRARATRAPADEGEIRGGQGMLHAQPRRSTPRVVSPPRRAESTARRRPSRAGRGAGAGRRPRRGRGRAAPKGESRPEEAPARRDEAAGAEQSGERHQGRSAAGPAPYRAGVNLATARAPWRLGQPRPF